MFRTAVAIWRILFVTLKVIILYDLNFNLNTGSGWAATNDNYIEVDGLFSDQGELYMSPTEPASNTPVTVRLRAFKDDITSANLRYLDNADDAWHMTPMQKLQSDAIGIFDIWQGILPASESLKYYHFQIHDGSAMVWLNAHGISSTEPDNGNFRIVPGFHTPTWAKGATYYQVFPDRFYDGNPNNNLSFRSTAKVLAIDGKCQIGSYPLHSLLLSNDECAYQHNSWSELPNEPWAFSEFFGGDLTGIIAKIDPYLKGTLGVTALYLTPIFQSPGNIKYDTQDYMQVDPQLGTNKDLEVLVNTAHSSRNMRMSVVLDGVFNHTSTLHRWFDRVDLYPTEGAAESQNSLWSNRYVFLHWPDTYCSWAGVPDVPKLNYQSAELRDDVYRRSDSIMQTYLRAPYVIDGWRYDVAGELVSITSTPDAGHCSGTDNHEIWQDIRTYVKSANPEALILAEQWDHSAPWMNGKEWDSVMNYIGFNIPVSKWINCYDIRLDISAKEISGEEGKRCLSVSEFDRWLRDGLADYPRPVQLVLMNALTTHDTLRFLWHADNDDRKLKLATIVQMTSIGAPSIYYGDEVGLTGNATTANRTFNWDSSTWNNDVLKLYRTLIQLRKQVSAFTNGSFKTLLIDDINKLYSYGRWDADSWAIIILNNDGVGHRASVPAFQLSIPDGTVLTDQLTGITYIVSDGAITVPARALPAYAGIVLVAKP